MLNRAIIESLIDEFHVRVRIPRMHKISEAVGATPNDELPVATICAPAGIMPAYNVGDIVFIDYENDDLGTPIVIGSLCSAVKVPSHCDITATTLQVNSSANLPTNTSIGEVSASSLGYVLGTDDNIQKQIDTIVEKVINALPSSEQQGF